MGLADSRAGRMAVMDSHHPLKLELHPTGSLRFLDCSVGTRHLQPPRKVHNAVSIRERHSGLRPVACLTLWCWLHPLGRAGHFHFA